MSQVGGEAGQWLYVLAVAAAAAGAWWVATLAVDVLFDLATDRLGMLLGRSGRRRGATVELVERSGHVGVHRLEGQTRRMRVQVR